MNRRTTPGGHRPVAQAALGSTTRPRLAHFGTWVDPIALQILDAFDDLDLVRLDYDSPPSTNWAEMARAHGYQVRPRSELREPWFGSAELLARCPHILALSSTGAGYDYIDVDACTAAGVIVCDQGGTNREAVADKPNLDLHRQGQAHQRCSKVWFRRSSSKLPPRAYPSDDLRSSHLLTDAHHPERSWSISTAPRCHAALG